ncbi:MAG: polymer-forming cytoskeletal protein [Saprospiraceae bacterium]|nr:polymer-forming cytoskeletal protein [Saprospiraceae bacterium]MBK7812321.1 polymer-forming cytoskeletal protein [Saprospiraceae bacterium]MBK9632454.1 polymer-forming cytoskeletal protein [Saprospiraceae bacterium]
MFGSSKPSEKDTSKTPVGPGSQGALNSLVAGTLVEGTVQADSDIRVDGTLRGTLVCKGKVIIGPKGQIEGEIKAQNAVIEGMFKGTIQIEDLLHVKETAHVEGEINTDKLSVNPGAKFNVVSKMSSQISSRQVPLHPKAEDNLR